MTADLLKKMNLKDQREICVLNAPDSFENSLLQLDGVAIKREIFAGVRFVVAFCVTQEERDEASAQMAAMTEGDAVLWLAYPKGSSKKYRAEFNRDSGWAVLGAAGFEPVRQVAIDADWSALRFRRVEYIKTMTRHKLGAISEAGRVRVARSSERSER